MSQNYLLADSIARIKNAQAIKKMSSVIYFSKKVLKVLSILAQQGYIKKFEVFKKRKNIDMIRVYLKYEGKSQNPVISQFTVVSKPGKRVFKSHRELNKIHGGLGTIILSTSKGIISDYQAREMKTGGEILCNIF